jgi:hypothetical protein
LLTVVLPETLLLPMLLKEYAPTATDMQPPYTFAPEEEEEPPPLTDDVALQLVNVLLEMA